MSVTINKSPSQEYIHHDSQPTTKYHEKYCIERKHLTRISVEIFMRFNEMSSSGSKSD